MCDVGSTAVHLGRVDDQHREPGDRRAVAVPRVDVAVERGADDLELAVAVEVGRHRATPAKPRLVRLTESWAAASPASTPGSSCIVVEARAARARAVPGAHVALEVGDDDLERAVTVEVGDHRRADADRAARRRDAVGAAAVAAVHPPRRPVGVRTGKPGSSVPSARQHVDAPSSVASTISLRRRRPSRSANDRARRADARNASGVPGDEVGVVVDEHLLLRLADEAVAGAACGGDDHPDAHA